MKKKKNLCEKEIAMVEIEKVIRALKPNTSPGCNGIQTEFYKKFWNTIKPELHVVVKEIEENLLLRDSQDLGIISLFFIKWEIEAS